MNSIENKIKQGTFLMACSSETYFSEIVSGNEVFDKMMVAQFGDDWKSELTDEQIKREHNCLFDSDNWVIDENLGATEYNESLEDGSIGLLLITSPSDLLEKVRKLEEENAQLKSTACCGHEVLYKSSSEMVHTLDDVAKSQDAQITALESQLAELEGVAESNKDVTNQVVRNLKQCASLANVNKGTMEILIAIGNALATTLTAFDEYRQKHPISS